MAASSEVIVTLGGGKRVDARVDGHVIHTDQPLDAGGEDSAPSPYSLFLSSIAACAGFFVQRFCDSRQLSTAGIRIVQTTRADPETRKLAAIDIAVELPDSFPEKYREAVVRAVDGCSVKRAILSQPEIHCAVRDADVPSAHADAASDAPAWVH